MASKISEKIQTADWKAEKHVPVIVCKDSVSPDEWVNVNVSVGKEIGHPNTTEHHIRWIRVYYVPEDAKFAIDLGNFEFNAHGEGPQGPNKGPAYTHHEISFKTKIAKTGTINAVSYCNIHGLWESSKSIHIA